MFATLLLASFLPVLVSSANYCTSTDTNVTVVTSLWDGQCFYPKADKNFELDSYLGRWYQVAGTRAPFTAGCSCIYAEYSLNPNGTVKVFNGCQRGGQQSVIEGVASAVDEVYGSDGVFQVQFPFPPAPDCPGPNYIVQEYKDNFAIVQASNFSTLFLLSRSQNPSEASIVTWLDRAEKLGSSMTEVIRVNQTGCSFT